MVVVRYLLAVLLAVAIIATALPIVDDARRSTARVSADSSVDRIRGAIRELIARSDPTAAPFAAHRSLTVSLPERGAGTIGIDWIAIGGVPGRVGPAEPNDTDVIAYSVDGDVHQIVLTNIELRVVLGKQRQNDRTPLVIEDTTTLRLTYRLTDNGSVILVRSERL